MFLPNGSLFGQAVDLLQITLSDLDATMFSGPTMPTTLDFLSEIDNHSTVLKIGPSGSSSIASMPVLDGTASGFTLAVVAVPEPSTVVLMGFGFVGLGYMGRRKLVR